MELLMQKVSHVIWFSFSRFAGLFIDSFYLLVWSARQHYLRKHTQVSWLRIPYAVIQMFNSTRLGKAEEQMIHCVAYYRQRVDGSVW